MSTEWTNHGDMNFPECGGIMTRIADEKRPQDIEYFQLLINDEDKQYYAFHGTIYDIGNYADDEQLQEAAIDNGYASAEELIADDAEFATALLIEINGTAMAFDATNKDGQGEYSSYAKDFALSEQELAEFMERLDIPDEFQPALDDYSDEMELE